MKHIILTISLTVLVLLVGCEKQQSSTTNIKYVPEHIFSFTQHFEKINNEIDYKYLSKQEQETFSFIDELISFYLKQDPNKSYSNMKQYLKNKDVIINNDGEKFFRIEDEKNLFTNSYIDTTLNDGSGLDVSFHRKHGSVDEEDYQIILSHLTQRQCASFQKYFNDKPNMIVGRILCDGPSYGMMTIYDRPNKALSSYMHMENVYKDVRLLLNLEYNAIKDDKNIYFTDKTPINSYFFNNVHYLVKLNKLDIVYIGGLNNFICKKAIYYQPKDIKAEVLNSKNNTCSTETHNIIRFSLIKE